MRLGSQARAPHQRTGASKSRDCRCGCQINPTSISTSQLEVEKQEQARQTYQLHKSLKPIPGSAEADNKEIQEADDIRLLVIFVIQDALGSLVDAVFWHASKG